MLGKKKTTNKPARPAQKKTSGTQKQQPKQNSARQPQLSPPDAEEVMRRGAWDRLQYKRSLTVATVSLCLSVGLFILVAILLVSRPEPRYFSVTNDFRVIELAPLSEPVVSDAGILNWCSDVVTRTFSLDFLHYRQQLGDVRKFYAQDAFKELVGSLKNSGIIDLITGKRLSVAVVLEKAPVVTAKGQVSGTMSWKVEVPVVASYESSKGVETTQHLMATLLIQRADPRHYPEGIYVKQMVLK